MRIRTLSISLLCALAFCALVPPAHAASGQLAIFQDDHELLGSGPDTRDKRLDEIKSLGADVIKLYVTWSDLAPGGATEPDGFDGTNPASYPDSKWAPYDGFVRAATDRGLQVLLTPTTPAPGWATPTAGDQSGVFKPDPVEFGRFVQAVATRYDGAHADVNGNLLPRVRFWSILNEPNHPMWLQPLGSSSQHRALSPQLYRELVYRAVDGFKAAGHDGDAVLFGELLPIGNSRYGARRNVKPIEFLREFFCLDKSLHAFKGKAARIRGCDHFKRITGVTGLSVHPYTRANGPTAVEPSHDDATIRSIDRYTRVLDIAASRGRLAKHKLPVYNTEFGYQSNPPDPFQTKITRIPGFLNEAEWLSYRNPRVRSWSQYLMVDDVLNPGTGNDRYSRFQTGLRFEDGREKAGVYDAYRLPVFARLRGSEAVEVWGCARPQAGARVQIQQRLGAEAFQDVKGGDVPTNARGYFFKRFTFADAAHRAFRFKVADAGVTRFSRAALPLAR